MPFGHLNNKEKEKRAMKLSWWITYERELT